MREDFVVPLVAAVCLALVHLFAGRLQLLHSRPRSRWLSAAGGVSVAYVFVHLLPELNRAQESVAERAGDLLGFLEEHVYLLALLGLAVFYGVESASRRSRRSRPDRSETPVTEAAFVLSIVTFATYNAVIGYLLVNREEGGLENLIFFTLALALHFLVNDAGLRENHPGAYHSFGRWVLSVGVLGGFIVGVLVHVPEAVVGLLVAFVGGGVILNTFKEELPEERQSRFGAFMLGAFGYAALLQLA